MGVAAVARGAAVGSGAAVVSPAEGWVTGQPAPVAAAVRGEAAAALHCQHVAHATGESMG